MTVITRRDWKLIGVGMAVAGVLALPVMQLIRSFAGGTVRGAPDHQEDADVGNPGRPANNIINICIMGVMATTRVNTSVTGKRLPAGTASALKQIDADRNETDNF